MRIHSLEFHW